MCIRVVMEGLGHFGEKCAYKHKQISPFHYRSKETVDEDLKTLKEELNYLKETIKILMENRGQKELFLKIYGRNKSRNRILGRFK